MQLTAGILLVFSLSLSARTLSQKISLTKKNISYAEVFQAIEKQTGFSVIINPDVFDRSVKISVNADNMLLQDFMKVILLQKPYEFEIRSKTIFIKEKSSQIPNVNTLRSRFHETPPITVRGRIMNENGESVIATITIKGTNKGTTTNTNGEFELTNVDENAVLIISATNIETISVNAQSKLDITVKTVVTSLAEVVINKGYYLESKKLSTGNVAKVTAKEIERQPISNPLQALQGRMPGVYIQQATGVPGGRFNIQIRGQNSLRTNGNNPLYIIDGVPFTALPISSSDIGSIIPFANPLNNINPSDISSIEILKDADATAIYGSRGANGVVLITTKKGTSQTKFEANIYTGVGKVTRSLDMLNSSQYVSMRIEALKNDGIPVLLPEYAPFLPDIMEWDTTRYTNWQKELIGGTSNILNAQFSISGGNNSTQFLFTGGYYRETSVFPGNSALNRPSGHLSVNHSSKNQKFQSRFSVSYVLTDNELPNTDLTGTALSLPPVAPKLYDENGNLNWERGTWNNPLSFLQQKYHNETNNFIASANMSYAILHDLKVKVNMGYTSMHANEISTYPIAANNPAVTQTGSAFFANTSVGTWIAEPQIEYENHNVFGGTLNVLTGFTLQQNINEGQTLNGTGYTNDALIEDIKSAPEITAVSSNYIKYRYQGIFARINYNNRQKYIANITARRDGSSRFGPNNQFANFGAVGAAWIFSNESFAKNAFPFLSFGKLRSSYGITGNDQIPDYGYLDTYTATSFPYMGVTGLIATQLVNPDYAWEINKKFEAALAVGFLKDRIFIEASWYRNRSSNQLVGYPLPVITGFPSVQYNFPAKVENTGWEVEFTTINLKSRNFQWSSSFNISFPKNKLIEYSNLMGSPYANVYAVGQPLTIKKMYHYLGVDAEKGIYKFEDVNKNGNVSYPDDLQALKKVSQDYYGGFQNSIYFKGLNIDFLFQFVKQTGYNYIYGFVNPPGTAFNQPTIVMNRWQNEGDITDVQQFTIGLNSDVRNAYDDARTFGDNAIADASFIRLKNLSISWALPTGWLHKIKSSNAKVYVQGQNLLTFTNYLGMDPENQNINSSLPPLRIISAGIQITY